MEKRQYHPWSFTLAQTMDHLKKMSYPFISFFAQLILMLFNMSIYLQNMFVVKESNAISVYDIQMDIGMKTKLSHRIKVKNGEKTKPK
jgi:hypothetical protein